MPELCPCIDSECPVLAEAGPRGLAGNNGADGTNGTDGINSFTQTSDAFSQPAELTPVSVSVLNSAWVSAGQEIFIEGGGYYVVVSKPDSTHISVENPNYDGNA